MAIAQTDATKSGTSRKASSVFFSDERLFMETYQKKILFSAVKHLTDNKLSE